jgi:hypothetical protein
MCSLVGRRFAGRIAGGTGKNGGRVAARLRQRDIAVRVSARSTGFDWTRPDTWASAIGGANSAYLTYSPDLAVPAAAGTRRQGVRPDRSAAAHLRRCVGEIATATGRDISFQQISPAEFGALLGSFGVPDDAVSLVLYLFGTLFDGRNAHLGDGVQQILGRPPRDFRDFARDLK